MAKTRTLTAQFQYAIAKSKAYGQSKHDERGKGGASLARSKTYSFNTYDNRSDIAKDFGHWLKDNHPEIRMAKDITFDAAQEFLEHKATCGAAQTTLERYTSDMRTLFRVCDRAYATFPHVTDKILRDQLHQPEAKPELVKDSHRDAVGMTRNDFEKLRDSFSVTSNGYKGCIIQEATGARSEGVTSMKGTDIHIQNGKCWVHLQEKGGRARNVDVVKPEYIAALKSLKAQAKDGYILNHRGNKLQAESLQKSYRSHLLKLQTERDYTGTNSHAIRKLWANERYHEYRKTHTKLETVKYMNIQLGHGADRDEALLAHYVDDIN